MLGPGPTYPGMATRRSVGWFEIRERVARSSRPWADSGISTRDVHTQEGLERPRGPRARPDHSGFG